MHQVFFRSSSVYIYPLYLVISQPASFNHKKALVNYYHPVHPTHSYPAQVFAHNLAPCSPSNHRPQFHLLSLLAHHPNHLKHPLLYHYHHSHHHFVRNNGLILDY